MDTLVPSYFRLVDLGLDTMVHLGMAGFTFMAKSWSLLALSVNVIRFQWQQIDESCPRL